MWGLHRCVELLPEALVAAWPVHTTACLKGSTLVAWIDCRARRWRVGGWIATLVLATGCNHENLSPTQAESRLRDSGMFPQAVATTLPRQITQEETQRNSVLRHRLDALTSRGLIRISAAGIAKAGTSEILLTEVGSGYRLTATDNDASDKTITVRLGTKVFDQIISVGELRTSQGAKVRDVEVAWHYESITPFGEVFGLSADRMNRSAAAAVLFGSDWRFINQ